MLTSRRPGPSTRVRVRIVDGVSSRDREDRLTTEEPLEIRLAWPGSPAQRLNVTMRTPGHDLELAAGFLLSEGMIHGPADLRSVAPCTDVTLSPEEQGNVVTAELVRPPRRPMVARYDGPGAGSSACGVCGKQSIADVVAGDHLAGHHHPAHVAVHSRVVSELPQRLRAAQRWFETTGGLHAAGLFTADGATLIVREDIGRHNAVDKVLGARLLADESTAVPILCVSGRLGFELVQKAVVAGIGLVAAVGAASSLAVRLAEEAGVCAIGFLRGERFVVYSNPDRVLVP